MLKLESSKMDTNWTDLEVHYLRNTSEGNFLKIQWNFWALKIWRNKIQTKGRICDFVLTVRSRLRPESFLSRWPHQAGTGDIYFSLRLVTSHSCWFVTVSFRNRFWLFRTLWKAPSRLYAYGLPSSRSCVLVFVLARCGLDRGGNVSIVSMERWAFTSGFWLEKGVGLYSWNVKANKCFCSWHLGTTLMHE